MPVPRANLGKPGPIAFGIGTQLCLNRCAYENTLNFWLLCAVTNKLILRRTEPFLKLAGIVVDETTHMPRAPLSHRNDGV